MPSKKRPANKPVLSDEQLELLAERFVELATAHRPHIYQTLATEFKVSPPTITRYIRQLRKSGRVLNYRDYVTGEDHEAIAEADPTKQSSSVTDTGKALIFEANGPSIKTLKDMIDMAEDELKDYKITRFKRNKWDTHIKGKDGVIRPFTNWQVKVHYDLKDKEDSLRELFDGLKQDMVAQAREFAKKTTVRKKAKPDKESVLLEIGLFDFHFGNLSWHEETGEDWDMPIATRVFQQAVTDLLNRADAQFNIERILFPIGNDFFHADSKEARTTAGTQMDLDTRWQKMFRLGVKLQRWAIDEMRRIAPVDVLVVPGNHDEQSAFCLGEVLAASYEGFGEDEVRVINTAALRKYYTYGATLLGFTHGCHEPHDKLPGLMAGEARSEWGRTIYREFHVGHVHHRRGSKFLSEYVDMEGVLLRVLPSLTATDDWHKQMGHAIACRAAEAYVYHPKNGLICVLHTQKPRGGG